MIAARSRGRLQILPTLWRDGQFLRVTNLASALRTLGIVKTEAVNKLLRERSRAVRPPPNPLEDPIAHIKRPLNALESDQRGQGIIRRGQAVIEFDPIDVKHIRSKFLATQKQFARLIGISYETLRNWEKGRRRPHGPARALLRAIDADPFALARALNWRARDFKEEPIDWLDE